MKAIYTKPLGWTNTKPTRIKAYTEGGNSITLSRDECDNRAIRQRARWHGQGDEIRHLVAARALCDKMKWKGQLIGSYGADDNGGYCFVFLDSDLYETGFTTYDYER